MYTLRQLDKLNKAVLGYKLIVLSKEIWTRVLGFIPMCNLSSLYLTLDLSAMKRFITRAEFNYSGETGWHAVYERFGICQACFDP